MKDTATEHANSEMSEPEAIRRAQRGDATAFEYLYNSHSKRVYTICLRMLKNRDDAEDLTQQVFLQVFRRISTFRAESGFATWLHRVTVNIVLMHLRRKRPEVSADSLEQGGANGKFCQEFDAKDASLLGTIDRLNLRRAIRRLPSAYRRLLLLHDVIGCQHAEIAGMLRCSRGASKGQLYRARKQLRDLLQGKRADDGKIPGLQAALRGRRGTPRPSPYYLRVDDEKSGLSDSQGKGRLLDLGQKKKRSAQETICALGVLMIEAIILVWLIKIVASGIKYLWALILLAGDPDSLKVKKDYDYSPKVSILLPCFNEGRVVYDTIASICKSDYPDFEIIAVDDCSKDDSLQWMEKAATEFPKVRVIRNSVNRGKNKCQMTAFRKSSGEIIICIDSDCVFAPYTMRELVACMADPTMGAVGGRVGVKNVNESILTRYQALLYFIGFQIYKIPENWSHTVVCISGCLFAIRRSIMAELEPILETRNWFGVPVAEGEDRFMTHQVLLRGLGTYINLDAKCWTDVPNTVTKYFKQQLRWRRSAFRDIFLTFRWLPKHIKDLHWNVTFSILMPAFTLLFGAAALLFAPQFDPLFWANPLPWSIYIIHCFVVSMFLKRIDSEGSISNPLLLIVFGAWWLVSHFFITILALFTLDAPDWGTRAKPALERTI